MSYCVKLKTFEGPLDLLLHLISKSKVKIEDISINEITRQYLDYLERMKKFDIEIASEFLVMAARLVYIKSCALVPKPKTEESGQEEDPRQELIDKLVEYKKYREVTEKFRKWESVYMNVYYKLPEEILDETCCALDLNGVTKEELLKALKKLLAEKKPLKKSHTVHTIEWNRISVKQRIAELEVFFQTRPEANFYELFEGACSRSDVVVTFLALLEMLKDNVIEVYQKRPFDDILIRRKEKVSKWMNER